MNADGSKKTLKTVEQNEFDFENDNNELLEKISNAYSWNDIHASAVSHDEFTNAALREIRFQLGYLPKRQSTLTDEPFIRHYIYKFIEHGDPDKLYDDCNPHVLNIWHRDMKPHTIEKYPEHIYEAYENFLVEFKFLAHKRIVKFLGHAPLFDQRIYAELLLRKKLADKSVFFGKDETEYDCEALTIIDFRMNLELKPPINSVLIPIIK